MNVYFSFTVGRLLCRSIRDYLEASKLRGLELRWHEGSGWIERTFTVAGPANDIAVAKQDIARWAVTLESASNT